MVHGEHLDCTWSVSGRFIKGVWGVFVVDFFGGSLWWYYCLSWVLLLWGTQCVSAVDACGVCCGRCLKCAWRMSELSVPDMCMVSVCKRDNIGGSGEPGSQEVVWPAETVLILC